MNKTGIWNEEILMRYCKEAVMSRKETAFFQEPTLLIIDSYGPNVKLAESRNLEKWDIYVPIIPPNLTNLMQPLDVAVNRSFQAFYRTLYDGYIGSVLEDFSLQTKAGNRKVSSYEVVSDWIVHWIDSKRPDQITNAFKVCSLVPKQEFELETLHEPLNAFFDPSFRHHDLERTLLCRVCC